MEIIFTALSPKLSVMLFPSLYSTSVILVKLTNKKEPCGEGGGRGDQDGEDIQTQGRFISMYEKIHYKLKKIKKKNPTRKKKKYNL